MSFKKNTFKEGVDSFKWGNDHNFVEFTVNAKEPSANLEVATKYKSRGWLGIFDKVIEALNMYQDENGVCYVSIPIQAGNGQMIFRWVTTKSTAFIRFLLFVCPGLNKGRIEAEIDSLDAYISYHCPPQPLFNRIANLGDRLYYDLADGEGNYVKVTKEDWCIVQKTPVPFFTTGLPVSLPERGGSINLLKPYLNISDKDFSKVYGWLIPALWQNGKFPILYINGPEGSGKTTITTLLRNLVDPVKDPVNKPPANVRELSVHAHNNLVVAYNNVSEISDALSDEFCRCATEGGSVSRKLFTDAEQTSLNTNRPILLNGIPVGTYRPDFKDRTLTIRLQKLDNKDYPAFNEVLARYPDDQPKILGALFDGLVAVMKHKDSIVLNKAPRMVEAAIAVTAAEIGMGIQEGTFVKNYFENIGDELLDAVENSVVGSLIYQGLLDKANEWLGTRKELMEKLRTDYRDFGNLPRSLKAITSELVRIEPALYKLGIIIDLNYPRSGSGRNIHIYRKNPIPIHPEKRRIERIRRIIKQPESQTSDSLAATR